MTYSFFKEPIINCPFCDKEMYNIGFFSICKHQNEMIVVSADNSFSICKNGFEFWICENYSYLLKYEKKEDENKTFLFKGYTYSGYGNELVHLNYKIPISPNNFDEFIKRILNLTPFL